ncbi:23S rRNA (pseudouridine(1915)-N(3))-methyltransferase RlmH [Bartonella sp. CB178]|uniref:23S rRNA (pseudouridine(1915)-N(3))-methyltransferase RlmH n=1 Tax=Bartonella sp. CB178 TaxID=3112255 RepID=UPI003FA544A1
MRIFVSSVYCMKVGSACKLAHHYFSRFSKSYMVVGLCFKTFQEVLKNCIQVAYQCMEEEGRTLIGFLFEKYRLIVLGERRKSISSSASTEKLGLYGDEGICYLVIAVGGHDEKAKGRANFLSFVGSMMWLHRVFRIARRAALLGDDGY